MRCPRSRDRSSWGTNCVEAGAPFSSRRPRPAFSASPQALGHNVRFTRPDTWLPDWHREDPDRALLEVTRRFLAVNGPAAREDLARWWGIDAAPAGRIFEQLRDGLLPVDIEGSMGWML